MSLSGQPDAAAPTGQGVGLNIRTDAPRRADHAPSSPRCVVLRYSTPGGRLVFN